MLREGHVSHRLPGRIRFKVPEAKGNHAFLSEVQQRISLVDGVHQVEANPVTGSVVVRYNKNEREIEQRIEKTYQDVSKLCSFMFPEVREIEKIEKIARIVESDVEVFAQYSRVATTLVNVTKAFNLRIKRATNNTVDLNLLFPLALAGISLLFIGRRKDPHLWILLLFMAFHAFVTLHQPTMPVPRKHNQ